MSKKLEVLFLGHTGTMFRYGEIIVCVDPFLSNSFFWHGVEEQYQGQSPWIQKPNKKWDLIMQYAHQINTICITHAHGDHCDMPTLFAMKRINPNIRIIAPLNVIEWLNISDYFAIHMVRYRHGKNFVHMSRISLLGCEKNPKCF